MATGSRSWADNLAGAEQGIARPEPSLRGGDVLQRDREMSQVTVAWRGSRRLVVEPDIGDVSVRQSEVVPGGGPADVHGAEVGAVLAHDVDGDRTARRNRCELEPH